MGTVSKGKRTKISRSPLEAPFKGMAHGHNITSVEPVFVENDSSASIRGPINVSKKNTIASSLN